MTTLQQYWQDIATALVLAAALVWVLRQAYKSSAKKAAPDVSVQSLRRKAREKSKQRS